TYNAPKKPKPSTNTSETSATGQQDKANESTVTSAGPTGAYKSRTGYWRTGGPRPCISQSRRTSMDGKIYYQVVTIDTRTGAYRASELWDGSTAKKHKTQWEAEGDLAFWARELRRDLPTYFHLGVQEVRSKVMPGHKPANDY